MFLNFKVSLISILVGLVVVFLGLFQSALAEPYLAIKTNNKCSSCHVNPAGGGARTAFGNYYGSNTLPAKAGSSTNFDPGALAETFRIGADLRANFNYSDEPNDNDAQGFETQSAQVYMHFQPKDSIFSLYIDEQIAPGAALNREAFIKAALSRNYYVKFGKMILPFGLRLEDDTAFIRQATQITFDNSDNGVELGAEFKRATVNFIVSNGSAGDVNDDDRMQFITRGEYFFNNFRVGASILVNDSEAGARHVAGIFAGANIFGFELLAEIDQITDRSITNVFGDDTQQIAALFEANRTIHKGFNVKLTYERLDPDTDIDENERNRFSALLEYTPVANFQLRGGVRKGEDIPQRDLGNSTDLFVQAHLYY